MTGHFAEEDLTGGAVDRHQVALVEHDRGVEVDGDLLAREVDEQRLSPAHTRSAHPASDDGRVARLAPTGGEDALGGDHAAQVVGVGLGAHEDDPLAPLGPLRRVLGVQHDPADGRTRARRDGLGQAGDVAGLVEAREHEQRQLLAGDPGQRLVLVDDPLVNELAGDLERRLGGALADPRLQHPQLAALDGELDVAQVLVVRLEGGHVVQQLTVGVRDLGLQVVQRLGVADAGDDVLALRVHEEVAVHALLAGAGVAGEAHTGAGVLRHVAEDHRLHVHGRAEVVRDALLAAVEHRPLAHPGAEDRLDGGVELLAWFLGERLSGLMLDDRLELANQLLQVTRVQLGVLLDPPGGLDGLDLGLELVAFDVQHGLAEHLQQPPVGVPGEPLVAGERGQALDRLVVEPDVQDGVHHAGHGEHGARTHRDQQRVARVTEVVAHGLLHVVQVLGDLVVERVGGLALVEVDAAGVGRDREASGDGQADLDHLGEVGALPAEKRFLVLVALGEVEDVSGRHWGPSRCGGQRYAAQAAPFHHGRVLARD